MSARSCKNPRTRTIGYLSACGDVAMVDEADDERNRHFIFWLYGISSTVTCLPVVLPYAIVQLGLLWTKGPCAVCSVGSALRAVLYCWPLEVTMMV